MSDKKYLSSFVFSDSMNEALRLRHSLEQALGSPAVFEQLRVQSEVFRQSDLLRRSGALTQMQAIAEKHSAMQKIFGAHVTPTWLRAIEETGRAIANKNAAVAAQSAGLSVLLDKSLPTTLRLLQNQKSVLAASFATTEWQKSIAFLATSLSPELAAFRSLSERWAMIDRAMLRANAEDLHVAAACVAHEHALEAQNLVEAIADAPSPEAGASLFAALLGVLAKVWENTQDDVRKMSLISIIVLVLTVEASMPDRALEQLTAEQRQGFADMRAQVEALSEQIAAFQAADNELDAAYLEGLERGALQRAANIREAPAGDAPLILRGEAGMHFAVEKREGRWSLIVVRDPLADRLVRGWVYGGAVSARAGEA